MEPTTWVSHGHLRSIPMLMATRPHRAPWASRAQHGSPSTACHPERVQSPVNALNQLCAVNKGKLHLWHKPPGSPSAEAATAKQLLPKSSPRQLRSSFLQSAGHGSTASTISHAVLKTLILIKLYKGHFLAMQSKARFSLFIFAPQTENVSLLSSYDYKIRGISPSQFQLHFVSPGLRLGQSLLKCYILMHVLLPPA